MKRGTPNHPKMLMLQQRLHVSRVTAIGILESMWHWTAQYAKRGDIGKFSNSIIAQGIGWDGDADVLMSALIAELWIDEHQNCRLAVHDWWEHADDAVHMACARAGELFVCGRKPRTSRLEKSERDKAEKALRVAELDLAEQQLTDRAHGVHTACTRRVHRPALPSPPQPSPPPPSPAKPGCAGNGLAAVARMVGIGGAAKRIAETPGMTPLAIVLAAASLRKDGIKDPGAVLAAELANGPPAVPRVIKPDVVCRMANAGWLESIAGVTVNERAKCNSSFVQIGAFKVDVEKLTPDALIVKGTTP